MNTFKRYILYTYFTYVYRESVEIKQIHISLRHCYCIRGGILIRRSCSFLCQAAQESEGSIRQFANEPQDFSTCQGSQKCLKHLFYNLVNHIIFIKKKENKLYFFVFLICNKILLYRRV